MYVSSSLIISSVSLTSITTDLVFVCFCLILMSVSVMLAPFSLPYVSALFVLLYFFIHKRIFLPRVFTLSMGGSVCARERERKSQSRSTCLVRMFFLSLFFRSSIPFPFPSSLHSILFLPLHLYPTSSLLYNLLSFCSLCASR